MRTDRREYPRVRSNQPIDIEAADGSVLHGDLLDISRAGLQFCCDGPAVHCIYPGGQVVSAGRSGVVQIRFSLAFGDQSSGRVDAVCQLVFSRRVAQDKYRIGVQFEKLAGNSYDAIERFINEHLT